MCTFTRSPVATGGSTALRAWCASANSSALSAVSPAKLWIGRLTAVLDAATWLE
jgi:hypothetical protein